MTKITRLQNPETSRPLAATILVIQDPNWAIPELTERIMGKMEKGGLSKRDISILIVNNDHQLAREGMKRAENLTAVFVGILEPPAQTLAVVGQICKTDGVTLYWFGPDPGDQNSAGTERSDLRHLSSLFAELERDNRLIKVPPHPDALADAIAAIVTQFSSVPGRTKIKIAHPEIL